MMQRVIIYGARKKQTGEHDFLNGKCIPSLALLSASTLSFNLHQSVSKIPIEPEPWKLEFWKSARRYICENLPVFLVRVVNPSTFSEGGLAYCSRCSKTVKHLYDWPTRHWYNEQKLLLLGWLCDPAWDPSYCRLQRDLKLDKDSWLLNITSLYVSSLCITPDGPYEFLAQWLIPKLVNLKCVRMNNLVRNLHIFPVLSAHSHLWEFRLYRPPISEENTFEDLYEGSFDPECISYPALVAFLASQEPTLQKIELSTSNWEDETSPSNALMMWSALCRLRHLTHLTWSALSLAQVAKMKKPRPLEKVKVVQLYVPRSSLDVGSIPFPRLFPNLESVRLIYTNPEMTFPSILSPQAKRNLRLVKSIECGFQFAYRFDSPHVFELHGGFINAFTNLNNLSLVSGYISAGAELSHLVRLKCLQLKHFSMEDLSRILGEMPQLQECALDSQDLSNYNEPEFTNFLRRTQSKRQNLKKMHLNIRHHPSTMTGLSAIALLQCSRIDSLQNLSQFPFSANECRLFGHVASERGLAVVPARRAYRYTDCFDGREAFFEGKPI